MDGQLAGQVAIVTGATQGIGRATALALANAGAAVAVLARTEKDVLAVSAQIQQQGGRALPLVADVTKLQDVERAFREVLDKFGAIDILVNNAGTGTRKPFVQTSAVEWDHLIELNFKGVLLCTRAALSFMQPRQRGCIINIASRAGLHPERDLAVYSATKAAVIAFSRALALEVDSQGIRIVAICPGPVDTERLRTLLPNADRTAWLAPQDVAQLVVFLASLQAERYNGTILELLR